MTVSTVVDHNDYTGNGVTTSFPYTFRIFKKTDLAVSVVDLSENITELVLDTDYTVTNAGGYNGGNVVLTAPLAAGWQISIARELKPTQETDLRNQGKFFAEVHEDAFDKLTMLIQQAYSVFRLALRKPSSVANWYDALNNYIRNLRDPRDPQDAATKNYVDSLASTNLGRTLRVPEQIPQLPDAATRANKMPAFDSAGNPIVVLPPSGSASDVLIQLAAESGASLVGGAIQVFTNVAAMKAFAVKAGRVYYTKGYYTDNDGGGAYYIGTTTGSTPDGYGDHVASNGVFLRLISQPTDLNHGVKISATYVPADARNNRNALQAMLRNPRWSYTECAAQGTYYILGSVNVGRDNITWKINSGCFIRGRYSDPSIPTPDQAGGMFNFLHYFDPDNGDFVPFASGDTRVNPYIKNVHVIVDGDISSEYNAIHTNPYNNNCIGIGKAINCSITGKGGCSGSDHRGFLIEGIDTNAPNGSENRGGGINCHIDVGYINGCVDNPAMIFGDIFTPSLQTIKVGTVGAMRTGGYNDPIVFNVSGPGDFEIKLGDFIGDNVVKPALVVARDARSVKLHAGIVNGAKSCLYSVHTLDNDVEVNEVYNTQSILIRAGSEGGKCRTLRVHGIKSTDSQLQAVVTTSNNTSVFQRLEISDNIFSSVGELFYLHASRIANALPIIEDIKDNYLPATGEKSGVLNRLSNTTSGNIVSSEAATFSFNFKSPAWQYTRASVCIRNGSARGIVEIDLRARATTANDVVYAAGGQQFNTTITGGNTINVIPTSPALVNFIVLHN